MDPAFVNEVRLDVLASTVESGAAPDAAVVAEHLAATGEDVVAAFRQLHQDHVYVLEPDNPTRLRMANPFSAVPTPFYVEAGGRTYHGNCVWDALGIVSLLGGSGRVQTSCPDCHQRMVLAVERRELRHADAIVHFSVPARRWWDDIIHT